MNGLVFYGRTGKFTFRMLATVLVAESICVFFGALVARGLAQADGNAASTAYLVVGSALAVACLLVAGLMRSPIGVTLGWLIQLAALLSTVVVGLMLPVGLIFLGLWVVCLVQGRKAETTRARLEREWEQEHAAEVAAHRGDPAGPTDQPG